MFSQDQQKHVNVIITTVDGLDVEGKLLCGLTGVVEAALNNDSQFVQLSDDNNAVSFIAKTHIAKVVPQKNSTQTMPKLNAGAKKIGNWARVLDVPEHATSDEVKQAYYELAKMYHPDLFSLEMPLEIKQYASEMLSRINIAYEQYRSIKKAA